MLTEEKIAQAFSKALENHNGKTPMWTKVPVIVAFFILLGAILGYIEFPVMDRLDEVKTKVSAYHAEVKDRENIMAGLLRAICVNTAKTNADRNECLQGASLGVESPIADDTNR